MRSKKDIPVEEKSYSALFFILSGLLGLVTLWGFWNETVTRRPWKQIQQQFYQYEYLQTKIELEKAKQALPEIEAPQPVDPQREAALKSEVMRARIQLDEALQERKFLQSEADAINYKYQSALHEAKAAHGASSEADSAVAKWEQKLDDLERQIQGPLTQAVKDAGYELCYAYQQLGEFYEAAGHTEKALSELLKGQKYNSADTLLSAKITALRDKVEEEREDKAKYEEVARIQERLDSVDGIKRTFLGSLLESPFTKTRSIVQYYLEDFEYTADRCATCHFAADKAGYEQFAKEAFEIEGDGQNKPSYQLTHPLVKVGSETVRIDGEVAEKDQYDLTESGLITFNDPEIFSDIEITYETGYDPVLYTHPHRDVLLAKHPVKRFGCTPCHGGQGQALTAESAHALTHDEYWLTPVLGLDEDTGAASAELAGYMQSNCRRCHAEVMMLDYPNPGTGEPQDYAPILSKGMALFEDLGCHGCHAVEGYPVLERLDKVGPSLAKVGSKVDGINWLVRWIKDPRDYLPETLMPRLFPTDGMTKIVYLKNGVQRTGAVTQTADGIIVKSNDGTEYPYSEAAVQRIVDEVKSIAAYLEQMQDADLDSVSAEYTNSPEAVAAGEELVKTVGCLGCHAVDGLGSDFAPKLDGVGGKVKPNFLRQWIADPKSYDPKTVMPSLRLTDEEVDSIVAYLMSRQEATPSPEVTNATYGALVEEIDPEVGESLVRTYGCFGCHDIPGFENESKVGAELGAFGAKTVEEFDFGDTVNIEHSWHGWTMGKLTNPRRYQTRRIVSRMPVFQQLQDDEEDARAIAALLKSFQPESYPLSHIHQPGEKTQWIDTGRRTVKKYNCKGCHEIEGAGGQFLDVIVEHQELDPIDAKQFAPPVLLGQGAKVYPDWLFSFLKNPIPIRYGLNVRMPTFGLSDDETTALVRYFSALSDEPFPYETIALQPPTQADVTIGKQIFEALECTSCHPEQGEVIPIGSDKTGRPDLSLAKQRLKADWIVEWLKNPQELQPGTAMPQFWLEYDGVYDSPLPEVADGNGVRQMELVRDYLLTLDK